ncbi:hypothetical protein [Nocardioides sp. 503]|uniref:hypothetical protein n=1 Tax=Nocardioides sp. 503 TaxID=2508326 RepID=UPI00106FAA40|nr:hypothetical protein [Nocardioides sp. 503]
MSAPSGSRRRWVAHTLFAASFVLVGLAVVVPGQPTAGASEGAPGAVTKSVTATRTFVDQNGNESEVTRKNVRMEVSQTADLRGRQEIHVAWDGAVPTGGVIGDPNASDGRNQEYPFVLLQCRGVDTSGKVPKGQARLTPESCWTQTSTERYLASGSHTPSWRFDAYADADDRRAVVGAPDPLPQACSTVSDPLSARWLPFRAAGGEVYYGGPDPTIGCSGLPPESDSAEAGGLPSNTTYGITGADGRGEADFAVWTSAENASLGCSASVSCSLVAVPVVGLSCDAYGTRLPAAAPQTTKDGVPLTDAQKAAADATCRRTGAYLPGEPRSSQTTDQAVRGNLWWSESNWRNRITVPLDFALTGSVCDVVSAEPPQKIMGSVVLNELTASWQPKFCTTDSLFTFTHVQQADALARTLVDSGEIEAAFSSAPKADGYRRPVVQAPAAVGGFAIAFNIDDANRQRRTTLQLNARLVAKLLTTSYPAMAVMRDNHPSIGANPLNITLDKEFQALNPGLPVSDNLEAAAALQIFSSSSDLIWALTSWIDADPEARAWLNGYADPWGMKVNAAYRDLDLPVDNWPLRDEFVAPQYYQNQNACYANSPTPFMQLIANPLSNLGAVLLNMQFASSSVATVCRYDGYDQTTLPLRQQGRQSIGYRFVLGVVPLSAARRYNLSTASLQTVSTVSPGTTFGDATGRTFVAPDAAGLKAATALLHPDEARHTWTFDYEALSTADGAGAYPGVLPVYAVVPTEGLEPKAATKLAKMLCYAGGEGQSPGAANGQLPAGYLPITEANGLRQQRDYTLTAAAAVRRQAGEVPALDAPVPDRGEVCDFRTPLAPSSTPSPSASATAPAPVTSGVPAPGPAVVVSAPPAGAPSVAPSAAGPPVVEAQTVLTAGQSSMFGAVGPYSLLVLAFLAALVGALMRWFDLIRAGLAGAASEARLMVQQRQQRREHAQRGDEP